jgi:integrase|tara:strand:- start:5435 stop:6625 length:1191 start_codon:yes stop_codon:yes gene_type:complete
MAFNKIELYNIDFERRREQFKKKFPKEQKDVFEYLRLCKLGQIGKINISEKRVRKILDGLVVFFNNVKKPITKKSLEDFKERLVNDKIKKVNGGDYSSYSKEDYMEIASRLLVWKYKTKINSWGSKTKTFQEWFKIKAQKKTPETLTEEEVDKLINACRNPTEKFLIAVLVDSGQRAGEFINARFEDYIEPTQTFPYYKIDIKEEYSKTEGRNIGLYLKNSTEAIRDYLKECDKSDLKKQVFPHTYDNTRGFLRRLGLRALGRPVHFHLFRKTSATFYASRLNRQQLCIRYGWKFSSEMPDIYIKRAGIQEDEIKEKFVNTSLEKLEKENQEFKTKQVIMMEEFEKLKENKILNDKFRKQMINYLKTNRKLMIEELETRKGKKPIEMIERLHKIKF